MAIYRTPIVNDNRQFVRIRVYMCKKRNMNVYTYMFYRLIYVKVKLRWFSFALFSWLSLALFGAMCVPLLSVCQCLLFVPFRGISLFRFFCINSYTHNGPDRKIDIYCPTVRLECRRRSPHCYCCCCRFFHSLFMLIVLSIAFLMQQSAKQSKWWFACLSIKTMANITSFKRFFVRFGFRELRYTLKSHSFSVLPQEDLCTLKHTGFIQWMCNENNENCKQRLIKAESKPDSMRKKTHSTRHSTDNRPRSTLKVRTKRDTQHMCQSVPKYFVYIMQFYL